MPKVFHVTLAIEADDDAPHPDEWGWLEILAEHFPQVAAMVLVDIEQRPYADLAEDPCAHTQH